MIKLIYAFIIIILIVVIISAILTGSLFLFILTLFDDMDEFEEVEDEQ